MHVGMLGITSFRVGGGRGVGEGGFASDLARESL